MAGRVRRVAFVALAAGTIGLGLWVHRGGPAMSPAVRDVLGDGLWAMMMAWLVGAAAPGARVVYRNAAALGICVVVELSQLVRTPWLATARQTSLGQLVLGSGFDPRDLAAYALGVAVAALLEWAPVGGRRIPRRYHPARGGRGSNGQE
ncbi:MAG: DUF2809 domain-containing protein [Gemmatimonadales bacterium]